jgi:CelD/BcsL family acetyltransferase involved in cellulose biosynthesis
MTMAAAVEGRTAQTPAWSEPGRIAAVDILAVLGQAETIWREFEEQQQSHTPYQRFDFLASWQRQVGDRDGLRPFIVIATDAERRPLLLLPLGRRYGMNIANFMGGKHSTFNMALWNGEFAATATRSDMEALISMIAQRREADVLALHRQPLRWRDQPHPIALLPSAGCDCAYEPRAGFRGLPFGFSSDVLRSSITPSMVLYPCIMKRSSSFSSASV